MRLKSINIYYLIGLLPMAVVVYLLALKLAVSVTWIFLLILLLGEFIIWKLGKELWFLPGKKEDYADLKRIDFQLPLDYQVDIYTCETLSRYEFILRTAEVISPLIFPKGERVKVAINGRLLNQEGERFMQIATLREIERYREKTQAKVMVRLVLPILIMAAFGLSVFVYDIDLVQYVGGFVVYFALPFLTAGVFLLHLLLWNRYVSAQEGKLDVFLTRYFPVKDVADYILRLEVLEEKNESEKYGAFNQHYAKKRVKNLGL